MKWITREHVRVDRVAIPWLIKKFVDPEAEFIFAPREEVLARAKAEGATPFDVPGVELSHRDDKCGFDAVIAKYNLTDPALLRVADIVRGADVAAWKGRFPESAGIEAIAHGYFLLNLPDQQVLDRECPLYDALYRYCQEQIEKTGPGYPLAARVRASSALDHDIMALMQS
ncbi:MAG: chromate resistance protein [Candidatus Chloroheliales bacterium]|nr:MAG: chromate resistance protein [Chloroflexota bacterium]